MTKKQFKETRQRVIERCIANYSSKSKYRSVKRWKVRMVAAGIKRDDVAQALNIKPERISEYCHFVHEPSEERFIAIEQAIYNLEAQRKENA